MPDDFIPSTSFKNSGSKINVEQENSDIIYEEVLIGLFGHVKGIQVKGIIVSRGSYNEVVWYTRSSYKGKLIAIHNHPQNTHFSPKDLYYFGIRSQTYCTIIQCHNGKIYGLSKQKNIRFDLTLQQLSEIFYNIMENPKYADKTVADRGEIFTKLIANRFEWLYKKGGM